MENLLSSLLSALANKQNLLLQYETKALRVGGDEAKILFEQIDKIRTEIQTIESEIQTIKSDKEKLCADIDKTTLTLEEKLKLKRGLCEDVDWGTLKTERRYMGDEEFIRSLNNRDLHEKFNQEKPKYKPIYQLLTQILCSDVAKIQLESFPKNCLFTISNSRINNEQLEKNGMILINSVGTSFECSHARDFVQRVKGKREFVTKEETFRITLDPLITDLKDCGLNFDNLFGIKCIQDSSSDALKTLQHLHTLNEEYEYRLERHTENMTEYQMNCDYLSLLIDWRAFRMGSQRPNRDAKFQYRLYFHHEVPDKVREYQPQMDLSVDINLVDKNGCPVENEWSLFMFGCESKKNTQSSHQSVFGSDIYKLMFMTRANLGLMREMLSNPAECTSVFSVLYHCGHKISFFIYYFHENKFYFHLMEEFDLRLAKDRYLLLHRLLGIESESCQLEVDMTKANTVSNKLKHDTRFFSLSRFGFETPKKRISSSQASLSLAKKPHVDDDAFLSVIQAAQNESIEEQDPGLYLNENDRIFLGRHGFLFETSAEDFFALPSCAPTHVDKGKRKSDGRAVICKKVSRDSLELNYLRMLNSEKMRCDPRNFAADLLEFFVLSGSCLLIMPAYASLYQCPFTLSTFPSLPQMVDQFTQQLCDFVSFLHDNHLAHLDIKPPNLATDGFSLVVLDFGLMIEANATKVVEKIVGTTEFLPPDFVTGERQYTAFELDNYATEKTIEWLQQKAIEMSF